MRTLFYTKFNWMLFLGLAFIIRVLFIEMSWTSYFAVLLSIHQFMLLFDSFGYCIPTRYLLGAFMCIQFFIGPTFAYNGLDQYQYFQYRMKIPEAEYFAYAIPAVMSFIFGLHLNAGDLEGEKVNEAQIKSFVAANPKLPYMFIIIGFFTSIAAGFFGSELAFVFYLLGSFKFIGLFLLILGTEKLKVMSLTLVIGSIVSSSLGEGMFHDLLTWLIFTGAVFSIKFRFGVNTKLAGTLAFVMLVIVIQTLKGYYRSATYKSENEAGIETFSKVYQAQAEKGSLFSFESMAPSNVRINQGFIITNIMYNVPLKVPYANGEEMYQIFEAALLPRFLAPNKLTAGNREIFTKYSGIRLTAGTSMGLSSLGDAYINFGQLGGCIFMFFLGWMYNHILKTFGRKSKVYPVLILFTAMVFYFPIRPDCELQTILGHLFKACFLIYVMIMFFKGVFRYRPIKGRENGADSLSNARLAESDRLAHLI